MRASNSPFAPLSSPWGTCLPQPGQSSYCQRATVIFYFLSLLPVAALRRRRRRRHCRVPLQAHSTPYSATHRHYSLFVNKHSSLPLAPYCLSITLSLSLYFFPLGWQVTRVSPYVRGPFPSKEIRRPPVVPGRLWIGLGFRTLERAGLLLGRTGNGLVPLVCC